MLQTNTTNQLKAEKTLLIGDLNFKHVKASDPNNDC